jgi:hypothetical protein
VRFWVTWANGWVVTSVMAKEAFGLLRPVSEEEMDRNIWGAIAVLAVGGR